MSAPSNSNEAVLGAISEKAQAYAKERNICNRPGRRNLAHAPVCLRYGSESHKATLSIPGQTGWFYINQGCGVIVANSGAWQAVCRYLWRDPATSSLRLGVYEASSAGFARLDPLHAKNLDGPVGPQAILALMEQAIASWRAFKDERIERPGLEPGKRRSGGRAQRGRGGSR
jgi:hypothetical protein